MQLPFLVLLMMLAINAGYGALVKIKADAAARFAGTAYASAIDEGTDHAPARDRARSWVSEHYSERMTATLVPEQAIFNIDSSGGIFGAVKGFLEDYMGRIRVGLTVPRDKALGQNLDADSWPPGLEMKPWSSSPITVNFVVASNSWTYHQVPMSFHELIDKGLFGALNELTGDFGGLGGAFQVIVRGFLKLFGLAP